MARMWRCSVSALAAAACLSSGAWAQQSQTLSQTEALNWLQRIAGAAQQLNYAGTFVYQHGDVVETSRIVHVVEGGVEVERLEILDGPKREVFRKGDAVYCYGPDSKTVRVDRRRPGRSFPQILPEHLTAVTENYEVRKLEVERVAEHDAQVLELVPKDALRYGHRFWADVQSGLLLKAKMVENQRMMEQFAFSQLQIGGTIPREWLKPSVALPSHPPAPPTPEQSVDSPWTIQSPPPGFRKLMEMRRTREASSGGSVTHIVLSDGLAAVSVFIEQTQASQRVNQGLVQKGSIHIYTRLVGDQRVTVLGETPAATVRQIGESIAQKPGR